MARSFWNENRVPKNEAEMVRLYGPLVLHVCKDDPDRAQDVWEHVLRVGLLRQYKPEKGSFRQLLSTTAWRLTKGRKQHETVSMDLDKFEAPSEESRLEARDELRDFAEKVEERRPEVADLFLEGFVTAVLCRQVRDGRTHGHGMGLPSASWLREYARRHDMGA